MRTEFLIKYKSDRYSQRRETHIVNKFMFSMSRDVMPLKIDQTVRPLFVERINLEGMSY